VAISHRRPSTQLSFKDAMRVHRMISDGWLQSRIAAFFDTNSGRISEINTGKRHPGSKQAALG